MFRLAEEPGRPFPTWAKGLTVVLSLRTILSDLTHGNVNLLILFLVVTGLAAFRRGRDMIAGILLALAIACKVTPALFIPYFLWKRAWRVVGRDRHRLGTFPFRDPRLFPRMARERHPAGKLGGPDDHVRSWSAESSRPSIRINRCPDWFTDC